MSRKPNFFKVGVFVIIALIILIVGIIVFGGGKFFRDKYYFDTYFDESVQGLTVGAPVKVLGVEVGSVGDISFVSVKYKTDFKYILVRGYIYPDRFAPEKMGTEKKFDKRVMEIVKQGFRFQLASQGITGVAFLNGVFFRPDQYPPYKIDWKPKYIYIPSAPSTITTITDAITDLTGNINKIDFKEIADEIEDLLQTVTKAVEDAQVAALSKDLQGAIIEYKNLATNLDSIVDSEELRQTLSNLDESLDSVRTASKDLPEAAASLRTILTRFDNLIARRQNEITLILENISVISEDLRQFMDVAKNYPAWILFGNPPPKLDEVGK
ncbi:MlaD family protein [Desulfobacterota bacterium AH_259_B03_O07]|nr:MlaD family protein [Desulfobacterota bacterium AH_259_B03_O07]